MREPKNDSLTRQAHSHVFRRRVLIVLLIACLAGLGLWLFIIRPEEAARKKQPSAPPAVPVAAQSAKTGDFSIYITGLGSVTPVNTVTVKTRVDGQLLQVLFREGQNVTAGEPLARIDPRPFEVQLEQAEGQMARDLAVLKNAEVDLDRYRVLWQQDSIPRQQLDTQEALVRQYEGIVKSDQGQIDSAKLQLGYCTISAPIHGRIGLRQVDPGNIVHIADANGLFVITQTQPITVIFPIPEDRLPEVFGKLKTGARLTVDAYDREQKRKLASGSLLTIDNVIDPTTGTIKLKATFPNEDGFLFPNQFVNARLLVDVKHGITMVPAAAVQRGPQGPFVFIVKPDRTIEVRPVRVGETEGMETSLEAGVSPGELVVVEGADRLRQGTKVELKAASSPAPRSPR